MELNRNQISPRPCRLYIDAENPWPRRSTRCECLSLAGGFEQNFHRSALHWFEGSSHCGEMHCKPGILASYESRIFHEQLRLVGPVCDTQRLGFLRSAVFLR